MGNQKSYKPSKELSEREIYVLQVRTNLSREKIQEWYKQFMEENPNGYMDYKTFENVYKQLYPEGNSRKSADVAFQTFDLDKSGSISFSEFVLATSMPKSYELKDVNRDYIEIIFDLLDVNKDGLISRDEMKKFLQAVFEAEEINTAQVDGELKRVFRDFDANHDNYLNRTEAINYIMTRPFKNIN